MSAGHHVDEAETKLREWLESSAFTPGTRLPSERGLASQLGLHHYAMNRAMGRLIADGQVARDGYKLIFTGKPPAAPSFNCHLIVSRNSVHIPGFLRVAKKMDVKLTVHPWLTVDESLHILNTLDIAETEGVVFAPSHVLSHPVWKKNVSRLGKRGIPIVCLSQPVPGHFSVLADNAQALQLAVSHLMELGHREIGLVTSPPVNPADAEILEAWSDLCRKHALTRSADRIRLQTAVRFKDDAAEVAKTIAKDWRTATALIVSDSIDHCNMELLQEQLARHGRRVPGDLSLLLIVNARNTTATTSTVSAVGFDMAVVQETAFYLAQRAIREKKPTGLLPPPCCLRIQCQLLLRGSTQPPASLRAQASAPVQDIHAPPGQSRPAASPAETALTLEARLRKAYPLAARASLSERPRFEQIDLGAHVNRPLNFRRGWLGDLPLKQFPPGLREIHGVPFNILGGTSRSECGAIVFHSAVNAVGNARKLPGRLTIPIGSKIRAAYVLHGCGYAKFLQPFARYDFHGPKRLIESIPLVSLGQPPAGYTLEASKSQAASPNIQDWWSDFPHMDFAAARMVPIQETNAAGISHHVYLYTLEWINPSPGTLVSRLEITANRDVSTTLGVLALTVLKL
ncbi:MAG: substrate-binding domain-containing protein [Opitutaceae bacterium]|jgi:DNA-binding LacI/PurR family transcriptional regulator